MSVATLRSDIAAALSNPSVWQVFSYPPASPLANSIVISPDDPYIVPSNNNFNVDAEVNFRMTMIVPLFDNQGNLINIEDFMTAAFLKLAQANNLHFPRWNKDNRFASAWIMYFLLSSLEDQNSFETLIPEARPLYATPITRLVSSKAQAPTFLYGSSDLKEATIAILKAYSSQFIR